MRKFIKGLLIAVILGLTIALTGCADRKKTPPQWPFPFVPNPSQKPGKPGKPAQPGKPAKPDKPLDPQPPVAPVSDLAAALKRDLTNAQIAITWQVTSPAGNRTKAFTTQATENAICETENNNTIWYIYDPAQDESYIVEYDHGDEAWVALASYTRPHRNAFATYIGWIAGLNDHLTVREGKYVATESGAAALAGYVAFSDPVFSEVKDLHLEISFSGSHVSRIALTYTSEDTAADGAFVTASVKVEYAISEIGVQTLTIPEAVQTALASPLAS